jgi:hypothetical protein
MKWIRSILAIVAGMVVITAVTELIEFTIVSILLGVEANPLNPTPYFLARNQTPVLVAKHFYNFIAGFVAGYTTAKIAGYKEQLHAYIVIGLQVLAILFAITQPEISKWLPLSLWASVTLLTILGVVLGMRQYLKQKH